MATYRRNPTIVEQHVGDDTMLFDEKSDQVHVLNRSAAFVWSCLEEGADLEELVSRVQAHYDPSSVGDDIGKILQQTLDQLVDKSLIELVPKETD